MTGSRKDIPEPVKRAVRQKCGFACIICRQIPYEYDHWPSPYSGPESNREDNLILLCDSCHRKRPSTYPDKVIQKFLENIPRKPPGFFLEATQSNFWIAWPGMTIQSRKSDIKIGGKEIVSLQVTDNPMEPVIITACFTDRAGNIVSEINRNEYSHKLHIFRDSVWDVDWRSNRGIFRSKLGDAFLDIALSSQELIIRRLCFCYKGIAVIGDENRGLRIMKGNKVLQIIDTEFHNVSTAINLQGSNVHRIFTDENIWRLPVHQEHSNMSYSHVMHGSVIGDVGDFLIGF